MSKKIMLKNVRLSFPSLWKKAVFGGEETKYEASFLINKDDQAELIERLNKEIKRTCKEKWPDGTPKLKGICLRDGDDSDYDGYTGHMSLKASNKHRFTILDRDKTPLTEDDNKLYPGCYVNALIEFWAQDNQYGKRVNANLVGLQFYADGDSFGSGSNFDATGDFDDLDGAEHMTTSADEF